MRLLLLLLLTINLLNAQKIALLIGNNDYSFQPLANPLNDVDGIYQTLREIGFEKNDITVLKNVSKNKMETALANFSQRATSAKIALVYFSGHGMQVNNTNYMFPAKANPTKPVDLFGLVDLNYFIQSASSAKYGIILVDACRTNPLIKYFQNGKHKGSTAKKGLGQVTPTTGQVVIGFATSAGDTADDGSGSMSPYARALSVRLKEKDDIRNVLGKVAKDVSGKYEQNPIYRANLASSVFLMRVEKIIKNISPQKYSKSFKQKLQKILRNLKKFEHTGTYSLEHGGIRTMYSYFVKYLSYKTLNKISPYPIFLTDLHRTKLTLRHKYLFGHYNPRFLKWLKEEINNSLKDEVFIKKTREDFKKYLGIKLQLFIKSYDFLKENPKDLKKALNEYSECIDQKARNYKGGCFLYSDIYSKFDKKLEPDYYADIPSSIISFWLRRHLDGTHQEMFNIFKLIENKYY